MRFPLSLSASVNCIQDALGTKVLRAENSTPEARKFLAWVIEVLNIAKKNDEAQPMTRVPQVISQPEIAFASSPKSNSSEAQQQLTLQDLDKRCPPVNSQRDNRLYVRGDCYESREEAEDNSQ